MRPSRATVLARTPDEGALAKLLGSDWRQYIPVDSVGRENVDAFLARYDEHHEFKTDAQGRMMLTVGNDPWTMPIPLVKQEGGWHTRVVRLDEHEKLGERYDVAVNVHSFSECSHEAIVWWLDRIAEREIPWLLIVPNTPDELRSTELDGSMKPFRQDVLDRGYELVDDRPIHQNDELRELIDLHDRFYLFRRTTS